MTWKEFKTFVESQGVQDTDRIDYIDFSLDATNVKRDEEPEEEGDPAYVHVRIF